MYKKEKKCILFLVDVTRKKVKEEKRLGEVEEVSLLCGVAFIANNVMFLECF